MAKVCIFFADGLEEIEGLTVVDMLRRVGIDIHIVSISDSLKVTGSHHIEITADTLFENEDFSDTEMYVLPGGMPGTTHLGRCVPLCKQLAKAASAGKYIASICAAPSVPGGLGLLKGKNATCYPGFESKLIGANCMTDSVVVDGNFITSRGMGTAIEFAAKLVALLKDQKTADELLASIMYVK